MRYLLDSNVLIGLLRPNKGPAIKARLATVMPDDVVTCSVVRMELIQGALRSREREQNLLSVEALLKDMRSLPFDDLAADKSAEVNGYLSSQGKPIGGNDLLIAGIALARGSSS